MISGRYITKIEGHGSLEVDWRENKVELHVHEGERLFEGMLVGRTIEESHWITPRICGVCPIAHNLASLKACENGLGIKVNETTELLRDLMVCSQMMQSHMLHLFFLSLPDFLGIDRGTELANKNPGAFKAALDIKEVSDEIAIVVAGRNVHPVTSTIGGFHKIPGKKDLETLLKKVKKTKKSAEYVLKLASKINYPELKVDLEFIAQIGDEIISCKGEKTPIKNYKEDIGEEIKTYSTAKFGSYKKRAILVGSLARLYHSENKTADEILDYENPFHNNLAQAIEILLYHERAEKILEKLLNTDLDPEIAKPEKVFAESVVEGIGAVEAPRGGLYHEFHFTPPTSLEASKNGIINYANIITPTVQNLTSIEKSAGILIKQYQNKPRKEAERLLNMLVRAYDPCITCSTH